MGFTPAVMADPVLGCGDRTVLFNWGQFCLPKETFGNILVATSKGGGCC